MSGELRADLTRDTFNAQNHFSRVLLQQGRVLLDADWNEQTSIFLHYLRMLATDLIGPYAGPKGAGFKIIAQDNDPDVAPQDTEKVKQLIQTPPGNNLVLGPGRYYVQGILCENEDYKLYRIPDELQNEPSVWIYLDVWERHITQIEYPALTEVALNGADTATRAQVEWQVRAIASGVAQWSDVEPSYQLSTNRGKLRAKGREKDKAETDPCTINPQSQYRGAENQLYRVEIHKGGRAWNRGSARDGGEGDKSAAATFKWSRENASVNFPIHNVDFDANARTLTVTLNTIGRDAQHSLSPGDYVEIVDDHYARRFSTIKNGKVEEAEARPLLRVEAVDWAERQVVLGEATASYEVNAELHPLLRRWDQKPRKEATEGEQGVLYVQSGGDNWLELENGVQVKFEVAVREDNKTLFRAGDYWLIPARVITGDVEWPGPVDNPDALPPHGVEHYFAPLALINVDGPSDQRKQIVPPVKNAQQQ